MAKSTHQKELERARARRSAEREAKRRGTTLVVLLIAVLVVGAVGLGAVLLARGGGDDGTVDETASEDDAFDTTASEDATGADEPSMDAPQPVTAEPCDPPEDAPAPSAQLYDEQPQVDIEPATVIATLSTTCGDVLLELDAAGAPTTVANFVALAEDGYYRGVGFHRVINGFMIQGGDPTGTGSGCLDDACTERYPGYTFADELALAEALTATEGGYTRGTLAMANAGPDTNGSQFFIVQGDPGYPLPPQYAVFGRVLEGMDVVDRIAQGPAEGDLAIDPVVILDVTIQR